MVQKVKRETRRKNYDCGKVGKGETKKKERWCKVRKGEERKKERKKDSTRVRNEETKKRDALERTSLNGYDE